jgi:carbon storage regulator
VQVPILVLTRKAEEAIKIGNNIIVTIVDIRGSQVRVGIEAPPGTLILRREAEPFGAEEKDHKT